MRSRAEFLRSCLAVCCIANRNRRVVFDGELGAKGRSEKELKFRPVLLHSAAAEAVRGRPRVRYHAT